MISGFSTDYTVHNLKGDVRKHDFIVKPDTLKCYYCQFFVYEKPYLGPFQPYLSVVNKEKKLFQIKIATRMLNASVN